MIRERIELKFWLAANEMLAIGQLFDGYWDRVQGMLSWMINQIDPDTADLRLVKLLAWQRSVTRFSTESETLFRLRVKHALENAKDAGGLAGFQAIFQRLGLGVVNQSERVDPVNWDVIQLEVDDTIFGQNQELFDAIIRKYGRTCRVYTFSTLVSAEQGTRTFDFDMITIN